MMEKNSSEDRTELRSFNPTRLTLARERAGLTKQHLAEKCGVTRRAITSWESGEVEAPQVSALASALGFPESFFYADDPVRIPEDSITFRALSTMLARQVDRVLSSASLALEFSEWMDRSYRTPAPDLPDLSESQCMESAVAAATVRSIWQIHLAPIKNMLYLLERKGVRVFSLPVDDREIDAFAFWQEDKPFIFLNTGRTAERMRFDLAHELGHLLLHRHAKLRSRHVEQQAQDFASSFLVPADALFTQIAGELRFDDIFTLKKYWNVSAVAMVQRLWQLRIISEWHYRSWMIELSRRGFRTSEPGGSHPETSRIFRQVLNLARQDGWSMNRIAVSLNLPVKELESMVFGLTMVSASAATIRPATPASFADVDEGFGNLRPIK